MTEFCLFRHCPGSHDCLDLQTTFASEDASTPNRTACVHICYPRQFYLGSVTLTVSFHQQSIIWNIFSWVIDIYNFKNTWCLAKIKMLHCVCGVVFAKRFLMYLWYLLIWRCYYFSALDRYTVVKKNITSVDYKSWIILLVKI